MFDFSCEARSKLLGVCFKTPQYAMFHFSMRQMVPSMREQ